MDCLSLQGKKQTLRKNDIFKKPGILIQQKINDDYRVVFNPRAILPNPKLTGGPVVLGFLNQKILDIAMGKTVRETANFFRNVAESEFELRISTLMERGLLIVGEEFDPDFDRIPNSLRTVKAYLMLTDRCNKNCPGCYVKRGHLSMTLEIGKKSIDAVMLSAEKRGFGNVKFFFFGGEPLLEWDLLKELMEYAGKKYGGKIESNNLQLMVATNGLLLDKNMIECFARYKVMVLVSIGDIMNSPVETRGSKKLWDNMLLFRDGLDKRAAIVAMMTATMENLPHLPTIMKRLLDWKIRGIRISLLKFSNQYAIPDHDFLNAYSEEAIKYLGECFGIMEERLLLKKIPHKPVSGVYYLGLNYFLDSMSILWPKRTICGIGRTLLMIDQLGRICSCQLNLDKPLGVLSDDVLETIQQQRLERNCFQMPVCKDCDFRFTCVGHCQKSVFYATGKFGPSVHCQIYKTMIEKWIKLQGIYITKNPSLVQFLE